MSVEKQIVECGGTVRKSILGLVLVAAMLISGVPGAADAGSRHTRQTTRATATPYVVKPGITFNDPYGAQFPTRNKLLGAINHTHKGAEIHIMTWSFYDGAITDALIRAHRRGATVQLIMSKGLSGDAAAGGNFRKLKRGISDNTGRTWRYRSWARTCSRACRMDGGYAMHSKWVTFSHSGASKEIVMEGSANLNIRAAVDQWNDWVTRVGDSRAYDTYQRVFDQAKKGGNFSPITVQDRNVKLWFSPRQDNLQYNLLRQTQCHDTPLHNGTTFIRVAAAVVRGTYGEAIARQLKRLKSQGCNIMMTYTILSPNVHDLLTTIRLRHLVYDNNGDGVFDQYLHMKAMVIVGHVGTDRSARLVYEGSANWSNPMKASDEQGMVIDSKGIANRYSKWLTQLFLRAPKPAASRAFRAIPGVDPYANVEMS